MKFLLPAVCLSILSLFANRTHAAPELYAFENGLGFGTDAEEAAFLKKLGYAGVSQVKSGGETLARKIAAYGAEGLRVLSVYRDVGEAGVDAKDLLPLAGKDATIELTIREMKPGTLAAVRKTCLAAEGLGMRVAIYPHHGYGIATMPQALDLVSKVDHPNLGVMFNLCHFLRGEDAADLEKVLKSAGEHLFAVSVSGADSGGEEWDALIKTLDQGSFDQKNLLDTLDKAGFKAPFALQCYAIKGDKKENLARSMAAWKKLTE